MYECRPVIINSAPGPGFLLVAAVVTSDTGLAYGIPVSHVGIYGVTPDADLKGKIHLG